MQIRELDKTLELHNDGQLTVFPVGTGSAFTKKNYQNNYILIKGDKHIMIDCGTRAPEALYQLGHAVTDIKNFLITHSHADHIGGLEEAILLGRYVKKQKPHIVITPKYEKLLWNDSLKGGSAWNESKKHGYLGFDDFFVPHHPKKYKGLDRDAWEIDYEGFNLIIFRTMHYPDNSESWKDSAFSTGLIIDKKVLFSGDTRFDRSMVETITSRFPIEYIFHDVQFFPGGVHAPFDELKTLAPEIKAKTILMHYPDNYLDYSDAISDEGFHSFVKAHTYYDFF